MRKLQFWYDFGSTYSYLTAMRIAALGEAAGVVIDYRPFLLGPIFRAARYESSPFLAQPDKLAYMWRDVARIAASRGVAFREPAVFPANGVYAARIALVARRQDWAGAWTRRVFAAVFDDGVNIAEPAVLARLCTEVGQDADSVSAAATSDVIKLLLRTETETAISLGIFGAPTFVTEGGEMFWGDDRLEMALAAA